MAEMDARNFLENLTKDVSLRAQLMATGAANLNMVADFAFTKGFVFTEKDLKSSLAEFPDNAFINQLREQFRISTREVHQK